MKAIFTFISYSQQKIITTAVVTTAAVNCHHHRNLAYLQFSKQ
jgi:hypothetical protein